MEPPLDIAIVGLRHPHAVRGHEPVGWLDTLTYVPELRIAAACDADAAGRAAASRHLPDTPAYPDIATMLRAHPNVRAALVLLPNHETGAALTELTEAGLHVAFDKPGARAVAELARAARTARAHGLVSAAAYLWRFKPIVLETRRLARDGHLGKLASIESRLIATTVEVRGASSPLFDRKLSGGGVLHWLGCHWLDLIRFVTGSEVRTVTAVTGNVGGQAIDVEDYASVTLELHDGAFASLVAGYLLPAGHHSDLTVRGGRGWADADMSGGTLEAYLLDDPTPDGGAPSGDGPARGGSGAHGDDTPRGGAAVRAEATGRRRASFPGRSDIHGYGGQAGVDFLRAFGRAVVEREHGGAGSPAVVDGSTADARIATLDDAVRTLAIVEAAYASAAQGRPIELRDDRRSS